MMGGEKDDEEGWGDEPEILQINLGRLLGPVGGGQFVSAAGAKVLFVMIQRIEGERGRRSKLYRWKRFQSFLESTLNPVR